MTKKEIIEKFCLDKVYDYKIDEYSNGYLIVFHETEDSDGGWFMVDSKGDLIER